MSGNIGDASKGTWADFAKQAVLTFLVVSIPPTLSFLVTSATWTKRVSPTADQPAKSAQVQGIGR
jgi:hypothetical protein